MSSLHSRIRHLKSVMRNEKAVPSDLEKRINRARLPLHNEHLHLTDEELGKLLGGKPIADGVILTETRLPLQHKHGKYNLHSVYNSSLRSVFGQHGKSVNDFLFLDTETTGLAGGSGTLVFLLGVARFVDDVFVIRQYFLRNFSAEKAFLFHAAQWVTSEQIVISYNGKSFDVPLLCTRYALQREPSPLQRLTHFDLLHATRRVFSKTWQDCRLQTVERELLEFWREDDISGAQIPEVWFDFVRFGRHQNLPSIMVHNRWDLLSLAALAPVLTDIYASTRVTNASINVLAIARYHRKQGRQKNAFQLLKNAQDALDETGLLELAQLFKSQKCWTEAVGLWQALGIKGNAKALEHLAKYFEHVEKNYRDALDITERLIAINSSIEAHNHRKKRLLKKIQP